MLEAAVFKLAIHGKVAERLIGTYRPIHHNIIGLYICIYIWLAEAQENYSLRRQMAPFTPPDPIHSTEEYWAGLVFFSRWYISVVDSLRSAFFSCNLFQLFNTARRRPDANELDHADSPVELCSVRLRRVGRCESGFNCNNIHCIQPRNDGHWYWYNPSGTQWLNSWRTRWRYLKHPVHQSILQLCQLKTSWRIIWQNFSKCHKRWIDVMGASDMHHIRCWQNWQMI